MAITHKHTYVLSKHISRGGIMLSESFPGLLL